MNPRTGEIYYGDEESLRKIEQTLIPLTELQARELTPMTAHKRKNYMRNQPCICGSGIKFKRCCWGKY